MLCQNNLSLAKDLIRLYVTPNGHTLAAKQPRISVIIPTLNEENNLPYVLPRIPHWVHEVLLVDGHSTDNTVAVAKSLHPRLKVIYQEGKGKGAALRTGFAAATGDIIVTMDADGSMDPAEMPTFIGALLAGADYVKGSRFLQGGGTADMELYRNLGNRAFQLMVRFCFGGRYTDLCYGYNAFWKDALPRLHIDTDGFEIETMMNVYALTEGLTVAEVPSFEARRIHGRSNLKSISVGWKVIRTILKARLRKHGPNNSLRNRYVHDCEALRLMTPPYISMAGVGSVIHPGRGEEVQDGHHAF